MKNETVSTRMATQGQVKDIHCTLIQGVPELTFEQAEILGRDKSVLIGEIMTIFARLFPPPKSAEAQLTEWVALYASVGITLDPATVVIPPHQDGFNRLIVVPKGMTTQKAYDLCAGKFPCWKYADNSLDTAVPTNDRDANPPAGGGAYAIWVRDTIEADECHKNKSADMLTQEGVKGITLMERLLLEYKYFTETGKHLDIKSVTLCSGSRGRAGSVPYVGWNDSKLEVCWCSADGRHDFLRAREAVSL